MFKSDTEPKHSLTFVKFIKNISVCYLLTVVFLTVLAVVVTYMPISEGVVPVAVLLITIASIAMSGFLVAKSAQSKGWLCGAVTGVFYITTLCLLGSLVFGELHLGVGFLSMLLIGALSGAVGGIIGVNMRK
ncbi:MAG: TIGR04086 family membrane protein [Firmicutes bacterium]|nr:TIGR04086 family membrane protein [Bacillota bacterium]